MKIALNIPGYGQIDSGLPAGVPAGGLYEYDASGKVMLDVNGNPIHGIGFTVIQAFVILIVVMAIIFAIWNFWRGGLDMMKSRGNKESFKKGRERIFLTALGLGFLFLTFALVGVLNALLNIDMFPFLVWK
jgi:hypothetical protein